MLHLVRHGRSLVDPGVPARTWPLDPAAENDVRRLRPLLPDGAAWHCSSEPKARRTAALLTDEPVAVHDDLRELDRPAGWVDDFDAAVRRCLERPDRPAREGWETADRCTARLLGVVRPILAAETGDVVLVGHGTAWTLLRAGLTGEPPDPAWWAALATPDVRRLPR